MKNLISKTTRIWSALWGLVMVLCGAAVVWSGNVNVRSMSPLVSALEARIHTTDALLIDPALDGQPIMTTAKLSSAETLGDDYLAPGPYLHLERKVEMFQWREGTDDTDEFQVTPTGGRNYTLGWFEGQIDFFKFKQPKGHENPALTVEQAKKTVLTASFGAFDGKAFLDFLLSSPRQSYLTELELKPELLRDPSLEIADNTIYLRRTPGLVGDALGDIRIKYRVLRPQEFTVVAVQKGQKLEPGVMEDGESYFLLLPGKKDLSDFLSGDVPEASKTRITLFGGVLIFFGLLSVLLPFAARFDLRPTANLTGSKAVFAVSAVVTVVGVLLLLIGASLRG